ncbi:putative zinc finger, BED-type containing protein [Tanacetum coccineum]|uniref:Zinc finger, BED-type containing protein n=1 Tax=Tanacetum coccineum TaxID=301880 RepID=A0ABQ5AE53_9ASTR
MMTPTDYNNSFRPDDHVESYRSSNTNVDNVYYPVMLMGQDLRSYDHNKRFMQSLDSKSTATTSEDDDSSYDCANSGLQPEVPQCMDMLMESNRSTSSAGNNNKDPGRNYGIQDPKIKNNFTCTFCSKVTKGGVSRLKQHLVGGYSAVSKCPDCPQHVRDKLRSYMDAKDMMKVTMQMNMKQLPDDGDDVDEVDFVEKLHPRKRSKQKGPIDMYYTRDKACKEISRWFYDTYISFNAATYDSFKIMIEAIGQFGLVLKPPSMYELRVPLLNKEVGIVDKKMIEHKNEWMQRGCSILSDGCHDSVVFKDIINFMVNSPKGSVFVKSMDVSDVSKNATLLFGS